MFGNSLFYLGMTSCAGGVITVTFDCRHNLDHNCWSTRDSAISVVDFTKSL
jgi:hypothetical protein